MPRTIGETMIWLHSYGPLDIPDKSSWTIVGSGPSATEKAIRSIPDSEGIISLNGVLGSLDRSDIHFVSHYEDFMISFPYFAKAKRVLIANPLHVGYRCLPVTPYQMFDIEYWSKNSDMDIRFFEKTLVLESSFEKQNILYDESTIATAALHLLGRNKIKEVKTLGIDGGEGHSPVFSNVFYYSDSFPSNYDKALSEFKKTAEFFGISVKDPVCA